MGIKLIKKTGAATIDKQLKDKKTVIAEETTQEKVEVPVGKGHNGAPDESGPFCEVGVEASYTHNLGDYKSARIGVSLKIPCLLGDVDEAFVFADKWVENRMKKMTDEMTG